MPWALLPPQVRTWLSVTATPDVAEAFVTGVDASGAGAVQRREEIAVFRPELAKLGPLGHDAAGGDGVALHGDGDVAIGRGVVIFGPDGVGADAPRPDGPAAPGLPGRARSR